MPSALAQPVPPRGIRFHAGLLSVWVALATLSAAQSALLGNFGWRDAWYRALLDWGPWVFLAPPVWFLAWRMPIGRETWRRTIPAHVALAVALSIGIELLSWILPREGPRSVARPGFPPGFQTHEAADRSDERSPGPPRRPPDGDTPPGPRADLGPGQESTPRTDLPSPPRGSGGGRARLALLTYLLLVAAAHAVAYHERSLERERSMRAAETSLAKARLAALQTQLQPHFFFNALNAIAALVHTRPDLADKMICSLADLMRGVLDVSDQPEIPLRRELAFIDDYLSVQKIRFGDRLVIVREIDASAPDCLVPPLLLQPLVENAVVHGVEPQRQPSTITLRARRTPDGRLRLTVINSCPGAHATPPRPAPAATDEPLRFASRVGLANTHARLAALHGADYRFEHFRAAEGGVGAEIELPARLPPTSA